MYFIFYFSQQLALDLQNDSVLEDSGTLLLLDHIWNLTIMAVHSKHEHGAMYKGETTEEPWPSMIT